MDRNQTFNGYRMDLTPEPLPSGKFVACAKLTRERDGRFEELWPDYDAFTTEAEAVSAAHMAAVAWIAHGADRA